MHTLNGPDALRKVDELLKHFTVAMLVTHAETGAVHARPMAMQQDAPAFDGELWFFTDRRSRKVDEIDQRPASLVMQNERAQAYLHLRGALALRDDRTKAEELWNPAYRAWFPQGLDDPDLALLQFVALDGEYWESNGGVLGTVASFAAAFVSGDPSKAGEAGAVDLR